MFFEPRLDHGCFYGPDILATAARAGRRRGLTSRLASNSTATGRERVDSLRLFLHTAGSLEVQETSGAWCLVLGYASLQSGRRCQGRGC